VNAQGGAQQPRQQRTPASFVNPATSQYQPHATTSQTLPQNPSQSQTRKESSHIATLQRGGAKHTQQSGESSLRSFPVPRVSGSCITKYTPGSDRVIDVAVDQQGSRLIQTRLSSGPPDVVSAIVNEIIDDLMVLTMDVFGNYVVQKAFEHADSAQQQRVGSMLVGNVFNLSVHVYGCRVLQKVLEVFDVQFHSLIVGELVAGLLNECVCDPNGNHVVQKAIELASPALLQPVVDTLRKDVVKFSTHLYGCRVMQRVLEYCVSEQSAPVLQLIVESGSELLCDQFGNYVVQHVIECGPPHARSSLLQLMCGNLPELAVHKFASNVVEKV
jgi:pumilio RNA-binding family